MVDPVCSNSAAGCSKSLMGSLPMPHLSARLRAAEAEAEVEAEGEAGGGAEAKGGKTRENLWFIGPSWIATLRHDLAGTGSPQGAISSTNTVEAPLHEWHQTSSSSPLRAAILPPAPLQRQAASQVRAGHQCHPSHRNSVGLQRLFPPRSMTPLLYLPQPMSGCRQPATTLRTSKLTE